MPVAASLPEIDRAVDEVRSRVDAREGALIVVEGEPTAGKSTVLSRFAAAAREDSRPVVELSVLRGFEGAPGHERYSVADDAGSVLLALAAEQLRGLAPDAADLLRTGHARWDEVSDLLARSLRETKAIVVIDDVVTGPIEASFDSFFAQRTREALDLLLADGLTRVVTTADTRTLTAATKVRVSATSRAGEMLDPSRWNGLGDAAKELAAVPTERLAQLSPLELRLAVALVSAGASPADVARQGGRQLVRGLFARLGADGDRLRRIVGQLALVRRPFDSRLLDELGAGGLDSTTRTLLEHGILYEERGLLALHETFAREASVGGWLAETELRETHGTLGRWHREAFDTAAAGQELEGALENELEAFHHFARAGNLVEAQKLTAWFTEQLDALGKAMSQQGRHDDAVTIYERALEREPKDWYAHHYLAYNLDVCGREPARVESEYLCARDLHSRHVWHHGRLACFYVTRARTRDARAAWQRGLRDLETRHGDDSRLYSELHRPMARLLLHRGQLEFAREILEEAPARLREEMPWHPALMRLLELLEEAEREEAVFPRLDVEAAERWRYPQLVRPEDRSSIKEWMPGRVTHVDEAKVTIRIATGPEAFGWYDLDLAEVRERWRGAARACTAGTYVEIVRWKDGPEEILVHSPPGPDRDLPRLFPRPDRYLRPQTPDAAPRGQ